jgi:hypothetical protein
MVDPKKDAFQHASSVNKKETYLLFGECAKFVLLCLTNKSLNLNKKAIISVKVHIIISCI